MHFPARNDVHVSKNHRIRHAQGNKVLFYSAIWPIWSYLQEVSATCTHPNRQNPHPGPPLTVPGQLSDKTEQVPHSGSRELHIHIRQVDSRRSAWDLGARGTGGSGDRGIGVVVLRASARLTEVRTADKMAYNHDVLERASERRCLHRGLARQELHRSGAAHCEPRVCVRSGDPVVISQKRFRPKEAVGIGIRSGA